MNLPQLLVKSVENARWLPPLLWQKLTRRVPARVHLVVAMADHFEPGHLPGVPGGIAPLSEQWRRLERWCRRYPKLVEPWRDSDGFPFRHTYFYPAEQYEPGLIDMLVEHCRSGWGEVEIHLHHGVAKPDTAANTRRLLTGFRDSLAARGCLSQWDGAGPPRYAFVHGNWALANSAGNRYCGVDAEMEILAETGCYADLTLPCAPDPGQVRKINAIYECGLPLSQRAPHRQGDDLASGRPPTRFPLMIQGPLGVYFDRRRGGMPRPRIENGGVTSTDPPTISRIRRWRAAGISAVGRPDWVFVKLHCHGMDPRDEDVMLGSGRSRFLRELIEEAKRVGDRIHFATAREMVNMILAACDGREGSPGDYRDYRLRLAVAHARPGDVLGGSSHG